MEKKTSLNYSTRLLTEQDIPQMQSLFQSTVFYVNSKDYTKEEVRTGLHAATVWSIGKNFC